MNLISKTIDEFAGLEFDCSCGSHHKVEIENIIVESGAINRLPDILRSSGAKNAYLISDNNTYPVAGKQSSELAKSAGCTVHEKQFETTAPLVPDEYAIGSIVADIEDSDDIIIAVGSGVINDLGRIVSAKTGIPYIIVVTAPSVDGYASTVSPLILGGEKVTKPAVYPLAIIADIDILAAAPKIMLTAGYGDIIGKFTCNADWRLANTLKDETYCTECAALVNEAVKNCAENSEAYASRENEAVKYVTDALILSGVAMGMFGNSRPASGAEHHFSHFWEVDALKRGIDHPLHGNSVAVGAVISAMLYELASDYLPERFIPPSKTEVIETLKSAGAPVYPKDIDLSKDLLHYSILHAMEIRERYTILRFCDERDLLPSFADIIVEELY